MDIDANVVRHSRKAGMNDIEKHSKIVPQRMKVAPKRGLGPPFWVPGGGLDLPFGLLWIPWGPTVAQGAIFRGFRVHLGGGFEAKLDDV